MEDPQKTRATVVGFKEEDEGPALNDLTEWQDTHTLAWGELQSLLEKQQVPGELVRVRPGTQTGT